MKNEGILRKAIEKAHANGYKPLMTVEQILAHNDQFRNPIAIIFTHEFAKAFWGNYPKHGGRNLKIMNMPNWEYHLQQMGKEKEPLRYLAQFLDK